MAGRNGLFSGYKSQRTKGHRGGKKTEPGRETERLGTEEKTGKQKGKEKLGGQEEKGRPEPTDARATKGTQRRGDNKKARAERL